MFTSRMPVTVGWGDCDPANIVYYPNYFAWFNEATGHHFGAAGLPKPELIRQYRVVGFPMVNTSANFHDSSTHGDLVEIETKIVRFGRASFEVEHRLFRGETLCVEGFEKRVLVMRTDDGKIKGTPIPEAIKQLFNKET